ncbi:MAG: aromatic ring-hydroxylating dioxygenase subunit alpha [Pedosphaera sp.]|jgi:Rieske 2Fe-2S family protein|nr:aromatic ring-hydroxylating dioxygenase subunit alpha [Pedosphaera sp.]
MTFESQSPDPIAAAAEACPDWRTLPGEFFSSDDIYRADLERVWRRGWLFVGHDCEIPRAGDFFTLNIGHDSLLVIRGDDGQVRAFHNVCRHRGTRLCREPSGSVRQLVCPYHQWVYGKDGKLLSCRGMQDGLDTGALGLSPVATENLCGFIFVNLAKQPGDFGPARELIEPMLRPQGCDRAKVAKTVNYTVHSNWKLVWENNRECYHCNINHPQYVKANYDHYNADDTSPELMQKIADKSQRSEAEWGRHGLAITHRSSGMAPFPDAGDDGWFTINRTPLADGYVSETMDGQQVAPLMGDYTDNSVGTLRLRTVPNMWCHASCDHVVSTRLLPINKATTEVRVIWLVDAQAEEGKDYQLEKLMPFWQLTSEQDWSLCEAAQLGVQSSGYRPGPYSTHKEYNVERFVRWYLNQLKKGTE